MRDECRAHFHQYFLQAMGALPDMHDANVLDMGCGTGVSICEMARRTDWHFSAVEPDAYCLDVLREKVTRSGWEDRFRLINDRIQDAALPPNHFDIILAEGLFNVIGFETGLEICDRLIRQDGWLILHDERAGRDEKRDLFAQKGYVLRREVQVGSDVWGKEYVGRLRGQMHGVLPQGEADKAVLADVHRAIALFDENPAVFESIYYVLQKSGGVSDE